jgi:hypothetical protein
METLNVVIAEILLCLALAWALGFLAAWILFRKVQNEYEQEIEELEENLSYASSANKNQEREITMQNMKIQEFEKISSKDLNQKKDSLKKEVINKDSKKNDVTKEESSKKEKESSKKELDKKKKISQDAEILKLIDSNLYSHKKK